MTQTLKYLISLWALIFPLLLWSQDQALEFYIQDTKGAALIGANVFNLESNIMESSDERGYIKINYTDATTKLSISYIGFQTVETTIAAIKDNGSYLVMQAETLIIENIEVIGRTNERQIEIPYQVETLSKDFIKSSQSQNAADVLEKSGQVFVQKSQMGGGSPILRGFEANKILLVVDGVRMNNAIYRSGHLQNAISVDHNSLERLELIFGPGSLNYGSDAIGGVIHYRTKNPILKPYRELSNSINYSFNSANLGHDINAQVHLGRGDNLAFLTSIKLGLYGDLRSGKNKHPDYPNFGDRDWYVKNEIDLRAGTFLDTVISNDNKHIQFGSNYAQIDILQKMLWQINNDDQLILNVQLSNNSYTERYDQLTEGSFDNPDFASWAYNPQVRNMFSAQYLSLKPRKFTDQINLIAAYQKIKEGRVNRRFGNRFRETQLEDLDIYSGTVDLVKNLKQENHVLNYGAEYNLNYLSSTAFKTDIVDNTTIPNILTRYPSADNRMLTLGAYINYKWKISDVSIINAGTRFNHTNTFISYDPNDPFQWPDYFYDGIQNNNSSLVGSIGLNSNWTSGWKMRFMLANAFRNPNIDDLAKVRIRVDDVSVPNPDLDSEKSYSADFSIGKTSEWQEETRMEWSVNAFYTYLRDAIVREDFTLPDGSRIYTVDTFSFNVQANVNADEAFVRGLSLNGKLDHRNLSLAASLSYTKGTSKNTEAESKPLAHIPPLYGRVNLGYNLANNDFLLSYRYNGWKRIEDYALGSSDNEDQATVDGTPSWYTLNFYYTRQIKDRTTLRLACENILDQHYRAFSSGISAPGRNFILSYSWAF